MLLRELEAFEACWLDLKDTYPTSRQDNTLIAHAMGQIVDLVEKPDQVEKSLPDHLKILFRRLAIAYFQGYIPRQSRPAPASPRPTVPPVAATAATLAPATAQAPPEQVQKQEISAAVEQVRQLANQAQARMQRSQVNRNCPVPAGCSIAEMDTLIVEFPEHWQSDS
ncbi:MAG: hypothetical protein ACHWZW_06645 [Spirulina sp.]